MFFLGFVSYQSYEACDDPQCREGVRRRAAYEVERKRAGDFLEAYKKLIDAPKAR